VDIKPIAPPIIESDMTNLKAKLPVSLASLVPSNMARGPQQASTIRAKIESMPRGLTLLSNQI